MPASPYSPITDSAACPIIEVAPGVFRPSPPGAALPHYGIVRLRRLANGHLEMVPKTFRGYVRGGASLRNHCGIDICRNTIVRLWRNGFIRATQPSPQTILVDVDSLLQHLRDCSEPGYWTAERRRQYKDYIY